MDNNNKDNPTEKSVIGGVLPIKSSPVLFYLLGGFTTLVFVVLFLLSGGPSQFVLPPLPVFLPPIAVKLELPYATEIDHYLTTTPYMGKPFNRMFNSAVVLLTLAFISVNFFNLSKKALVATTLLTQVYQFKLMVTVVPLTAFAIFTSSTVAIAFFQVSLIFFVFAPFFLILKRFSRLYYSPRLRTIVYNATWIDKEPLTLLAFKIFVGYTLVNFVVSLFNPNETAYLVNLLKLITETAGVVVNIEEPLSYALQVSTYLQYGLMALLLLCFILLILIKSKVALAISVIIISCGFARYLFFLPVIKPFLPLFNLKDLLLVNLVQVVLITVVLWGATLFFLFKKYTNRSN